VISVVWENKVFKSGHRSSSPPSTHYVRCCRDWYPTTDRRAIQRVGCASAQIALSSNTLSEPQLYDYGIYRLRQMLAPIHDVTPGGGKYRQIMVDIDPA
jgi:hypothetical protein